MYGIYHRIFHDVSRSNRRTACPACSPCARSVACMCASVPPTPVLASAHCCRRQARAFLRAYAALKLLRQGAPALHLKLLCNFFFFLFFTLILCLGVDGVSAARNHHAIYPPLDIYSHPPSKFLPRRPPPTANVRPEVTSGLTGTTTTKSRTTIFHKISLGGV